MRLSGIYSYPVKSLGGITHKQALVKERGLQYDRRWMLVDPNGRFITQRENMLMADLICRIEDGFIHISSKTRSSLSHRFPTEILDNQVRVHIQVWDSSFEAAHVGTDHDQFFSEALHQSCRLVFIDSESERKANKLITGQTTSVSFADAYPYLIISQASLNDLNGRLDRPVEMSRFRPNLVIDGCHPYEEDSFDIITIGKIRFRIVKPCARCVLTTIDPKSYNKGKEPLATLAQYRTKGNQVMFGVNAIALDYGVIQLDESIDLLSGSIVYT